ncbi:APC family permease, partial [Escherichia coli]
VSLGFLTGVNIIGVRSAARTGVVLVIGKMLPLLLFVAIGAFYIDPQLAFSGQRPDPHDLQRMGEAALLLLYAYAGFENIPAAAGEYRNPRRDIPFALITMIITVTVIYGAVQVVAQGTLAGLASSATPLADAAAGFGGEALALILTIGATISILGTNSNTMMMGPRFLFAL